MAVITQNYDIDLKATGEFPVVKMSQFDTGSRTIVFTVYDGRELAQIDGMVARVDGTRNDGVEFSSTCTVGTGSKVSFTISQEMTKHAGKHAAELVIFDSSGNPAGTQNFIIEVEAAAMRRDSAASADDRTLYDQFTGSVSNAVTDKITQMDSEYDDFKKFMSARIDNLIVPSGKESSAEVIDARLGFDGRAYDTLGTAIRTQVSDLNNNMDNYIYYNYEYSENRLSIDNLTKDKYIDKNGTILDSTGWNLSDFIPVEKNETYVWTYDIPATHSVPNVYYGLFDINRKWIGKGTTEESEGETKIKTNDNTAYVRISQSSKYFTDKAMVIRKTLYDQGIKEFIPFKRYLKNSPTKEIEEKTNTIEGKTNTFDTNYQPSYDNVVRSIQRIGSGMEHPIHSVEAFKDAYRKGFRILLCDLIFTSDNIPVCNHDYYLNENYKNVYDSNGDLVSTDNPIYFSQNTYETLSKYNFGAMGYPLLKFADMLKLVKQLGVELYVEVKGMTEQQAKIACDLVKQFGLSDKTSWAGTLSQMSWIVTNIDTARVSLMPSDVTDEVIENLNSLKTGKNKVFVFGWDTTTLTGEIVNKLIQNGIAFEQGTLNTEQDIESYFARGNQYYYCTGVESETVIAGKVLLESSLSKVQLND